MRQVIKGNDIYKITQNLNAQPFQHKPTAQEFCKRVADVLGRAISLEQGRKLARDIELDLEITRGGKAATRVDEWSRFILSAISDLYEKLGEEPPAYLMRAQSGAALETLKRSRETGE